MNILTIVTPTYNRANEIIRLFESLLKQSTYDFTWLVIDDGSSDNISEVIFNAKLKSPFQIEFVQLENSGKHKAINYSVGKIKSELLFIVDSDDFLTSDAVERITSDWDQFKNEVIGLSYLRSYPSGEVIGSKFTSDYLISTHSDERIINKTYGDKAEVWKTSEFTKSPFLEFESEKFFSEQHKYLSISGNGKVLFINKSIYVCEYLSDGLSSKIRQLQFENPNGTLANALIISSDSYPFLIRVKSFLKVFAFSIISKKKIYKTLNESDFSSYWILLSPLGLLYFLFLNLQYIYLKR
jgi:glycosyltransferase involved in cell wall biosynthesis